jgi:hypothetical protein
VLQLNAAGTRDNFFDLGGDSLRAVQVASRVRERFKLDLPIASILDNQTIEAMAHRIAEESVTVDRSANEPLQDSNECPASFVQERLWFLHRLDPASDAYNLPFALRVKGKLDLSALARAVQGIVARHNVLRTTFREVDGKLVQCFQPELPVAAELELPPFRVPNEEALQRLLVQEARVPFDLEHGPLFRTRLICRREREHVLLVTAHHAVFDGWSVGLFINELQTLYERLTSDSSARNPAPPPAQYAHYARWQRHHMQGAALEKELSWWKQNLEGARGDIRLAPDPMPLPSPAREASRLTVKLSAARTRQLRQAAQRARSTPFTVLLTTLASALHQLTGQNDLVIGTVVAGRTRREFESLLGCFMNFLPLRVRVQEGEELAQLLRRTCRVLNDAQSHQECPFEKIVTAVNPERTAANPLYNVALLWQEFPVTTANQKTKLHISSMDVFTHGNLLDLRVEAEPAGAALSLNFEYNPQAISTERMQELIRLWLRAISELIEQGKPQAIADGTSVKAMLRRVLTLNLDAVLPRIQDVP